MCDSFNIPLVFFVDNPGFVIGIEAERQRAPGKIINFMNALQLVTVPKLTVMIRKNYGQAYINMGGGKNADDVCAWVTAEVSFMDPAFAVNVVHGREGKRLEQDDPTRFQEAYEKIQQENSVWDLAACYAVQQVIKPEETRDWLLQMLRVHERRLSGGIGKHMLSNCAVCGRSAFARLRFIRKPMQMRPISKRRTRRMPSGRRIRAKAT
jgi:acetyl-CoA carboxylase carboxyltransferase component